MNYFIFIVIVYIVILGILLSYLYNPFEYPHIIVNFDISKKRQPVYDDYIDQWVNNLPDHCINSIFIRTLNKWDDDCVYYLKHCLLWKSHRKNLYIKMRCQVFRNDYAMFQFVFIRNQTKYYQKNCQKFSYVAQSIENTVSLSLNDMLNIVIELNEIDFEMTRTKWNEKNQRKLVTKELRTKIKKRDNFTCQICGKYMPDEVGLHIDHIIPIKKVESL